MRYNIFYTSIFSNNILDIDEEALKVVVSAYKQGKKEFTLSGKNYEWHFLSYIKIYTNPKDYSSERIIILAKLSNQYNQQWSYVNDSYLLRIGKDVTAEFIGHKSFGEDKIIGGQVIIQNNSCVDESRIDSLKAMNCQFDLSKLIRLCEELNANYNLGNYYSVAMLGRAIIDHIPPVFGCKTFNEVSNNYGSKSIKGSLRHLNESMRNISDGILHSHIRKNENIPTVKQVNFSQDLDVLLGEVIGVLNTD